MNFEWDEAKAAANLARHGVSFQEAVAVFTDPTHVIVDATRVVDGEPRSKAIGQIAQRLYAVVHTLRGGTCRLISARRVNAKERRIYDAAREIYP